MVIGEARPTDADVRHVQAQPGMGATAESQGQIIPPRKHQGVLGGKERGKQNGQCVNPCKHWARLFI